jgi:hypothetical protein
MLLGTMSGGESIRIVQQCAAVLVHLRTTTPTALTALRIRARVDVYDMQVSLCMYVDVLM